jgi:uncharacterized protein YecE (DUF72 family)
MRESLAREGTKSTPMHPTGMYRIGTAGWSVPAKPKEEGSHLHHYSRTLNCAEINSTFYRPHRASTWLKWAAETPANFRFSIKAPKTITHEAKLRNAELLLQAFVDQIKPLQEKQGPLLFQLPPSLAFDLKVAESFFRALRSFHDSESVLEPRHATWFTDDANALLKRYKIARVAADPAKASPEAAFPGGDLHLQYFRLHGSPRTYYSNYEPDFLSALAERIEPHKNTWVIFDNTTLSHAYPNALKLQNLMSSDR